MFTTNVLISLFYSFKLISLMVIVSCFYKMRSNRFLTDTQRKFFVFIGLSSLIGLVFLVFIPLVAIRLVDLRKTSFLAHFFNDLFLLALLNFIVLHLRQTEMHVLVDLGVYKNIDTMNDKELFAEYDKLLVSAKKMRKITKRGER